MHKNKISLLNQKELKWLMENPGLNWLRWILILPTALIGVALGLFLQFSYSWFYEPPIWMLNYLIAPIYTVFSSILFIVMGTEMAPMYRNTVSIILLIIAIMTLGICGFSLVIIKNYTPLIYVLSGFLGICFGYAIEYSNQKETI